MNQQTFQANITMPNIWLKFELKRMNVWMCTHCVHAYAYILFAFRLFYIFHVPNKHTVNLCLHNFKRTKWSNNNNEKEINNKRFDKIYHGISFILSLHIDSKPTKNRTIYCSFFRQFYCFTFLSLFEVSFLWFGKFFFIIFFCSVIRKLIIF